MADDGIDTRGEAWRAWRAKLGDAMPSTTTPGHALAWELGALRIEVRAGLGHRVELAVAVETGLTAWALPRAACPSDAGCIASGDAALDAEVALFGDVSLLAALDAPTRKSLRSLVVARGGRLDGGILRMDAAATAALDPERIGETLALFTRLADTLRHAHGAFDATLARTLDAETSRSVRARLEEVFRAHPTVGARRARAIAERAREAGEAGAVDLAALLAVIEDRAQPNRARLRSARAMLDAIDRSRPLDGETCELLARLAEVSGLPESVRSSALAAVLAGGPAEDFPSLRVALLSDHLPEIVVAMRRSPEHRRAGARQLLASELGEEPARYTGRLANDDLTYVAEAIREVGGRCEALRLLAAACTSHLDDALLLSVVPALARVDCTLDDLLSALDPRILDDVDAALVRIAPRLPDGVAVLCTLYPGLDDAERKRAVIDALVALGDARATELLVAACEDDDESVSDAAIEALGALGDSRALPVLEQLGGGLFRSRARKNAARQAAERVRAREGDRAGALALAGEVGEIGGLALDEE